MDEYGMNEFEMIKKADVMRIINAENAVVLNNRKERSTDEVLCAIAAKINGLQTTAKSGSRLIDADAFTEQYGNYYAEQGTAEGFIGTVGDLIAKQPTIEADIDRAAILRLLDEADDIVSALYRQGANKDYKCKSLCEKLKAIETEITAPQESNEMLFRKILAEVDYYYSTRKQMCYPIGYLDMLIYAVHCAVNGNHEEALYAIERVRKAREGA